MSCIKVDTVKEYVDLFKSSEDIILKGGEIQR